MKLSQVGFYTSLDSYKDAFTDIIPKVEIHPFKLWQLHIIKINTVYYYGMHGTSKNNNVNNCDIVSTLNISKILNLSLYIDCSSTWLWHNEVKDCVIFHLSSKQPVIEFHLVGSLLPIHISSNWQGWFVIYHVQYTSSSVVHHKFHNSIWEQHVFEAVNLLYDSTEIDSFCCRWSINIPLMWHLST